jgi:hypothetical protein
MSTIADLGRDTNTKAACAALGVPRATYYRQAAKAWQRPISWSDHHHHWHSQREKSKVFSMYCMSRDSVILRLPSVCHLAGRRDLSLLDPHHVPNPGKT